MALTKSKAQIQDELIREINNPTLLSLRVELSRAHQAIGDLLPVVDDEASDHLVACRTYINQAMKELKKVNDR